MIEAVASAAKPECRFYDGKFHWYPAILNKPGDEHNSRRLGVSWLWFLICDNMAPTLSIDVTLEFWGFTVRISVPYISFYLRILFPTKLDSWAHRNLWRVGERSKYGWQK